MSKLIANVGGMFSGKTTALLQQGERHIRADKKVLYVKPEGENRYSESKIISHNGQQVDAMVMPRDKILFIVADYDVVLIDEVQFFKPSIMGDINAMLNDGIEIIVSGLDMDFEGKPFETTMLLMGIADEVKKHKSICKICKQDSHFSFRTNESKERELLGESDSYIPLCRKCYNKQMTKGLGE